MMQTRIRAKATMQKEKAAHNYPGGVEGLTASSELFQDGMHAATQLKKHYFAFINRVGT